MVRVQLPIRVHGVEPLMSHGESRRVIRFSANNFDVAGRLCRTGFYQRVELAERRYLGREPVLAAQGGGQQMVVLRGQVIVYPVRIFFERARPYIPDC